jgi:nicotinamidase-related amidase
VWWINNQGNHPDPFTEISYHDLFDKWYPVYEIAWSTKYLKTLGSLTIWPVHCSAYQTGSLIYDPLGDAIKAHASINNKPPIIIKKGQNPRTEHYGIFGAEVVDPEDEKTKIDAGLLAEISMYHLTYWFGQEKNHCVRRTLEQYIAWCEINVPAAISRMRLLEDCTSLLPLGQEYERDAEEAIERMVKKGMKVVKSTDPIS